MLRDDAETLVGVDELVVGDVVLLQAGDVVPADCRVLEAKGAIADESRLTGESFPVTKTRAADDASTFVADRRSMLFEGSTIVGGEPVAVVVAVGDDTEAAAALTTPGRAPTASGVEQRLTDIARLTVPITLASAGFVTLNAMLRRRPVRAAITSGVGLVAAALPEGLPVVATTAQLAAARRLSTHNVIVRTPRALEALGRVDMLCFDKTGTLTEGDVVVRGVVAGNGFEPVEDLGSTGRALLTAALRATALDGNGDSNGHGRIHSADRALADVAETAGLDADRTVAAELPFEHERSFHAIRSRDADGWTVTVKGAPETVLPRCTTWLRGDQTVALDGDDRRAAERETEDLAADGYRVLAVAIRSASSRPELDDDDVQDLELVGFVALVDRVRDTARDAVKGLRRAGIEVAMITGDHPRTARAVAESTGALDGRQVLAGTEIDEMTDDELTRVVDDVAVFVRVTPLHKARIVQALQRRGRVVAMTGDGTNDAAAIRFADAGLALGRRATPAARQAADVVITDDRLETILDAIIEGRAMWAAVRDAIGMLVGGNLGELAFAIVVGGISGTSPMNARQTLLVNLLTDMLPAAAIASRPPHDLTPEALVEAGPDTALGHALRNTIMMRACITGGAASTSWVVARLTGRRAHADTVGLVSLVTSQLGQTLVASRCNPPVVLATLVSTAALVAAVEVPGVNRFFGCTPLGPIGWTIGLTSAVVATGTSVVVPRVYALVAGSDAQARREKLPEEPLGEQDRQLHQEERHEFLHGNLRHMDSLDTERTHST